MALAAVERFLDKIGERRETRWFGQQAARAKLPHLIVGQAVGGTTGHEYGQFGPDLQDLRGEINAGHVGHRQI